jgi:hypothetical protein
MPKTSKRTRERRDVPADPPPMNRTPDSRDENPREQGLGGEAVADKGAAGAPQGGRIDGRHGEQQGTKY